jgi:hypothetical protein
LPGIGFENARPDQGASLALQNRPEPIIRREKPPLSIPSSLWFASLDHADVEITAIYQEKAIRKLLLVS